VDVTLSWQHMTYKHNKLGQADLVFVCDHSSSGGLYVQEYSDYALSGAVLEENIWGGGQDKTHF